MISADNNDHFTTSILSDSKEALTHFTASKASALLSCPNIHDVDRSNADTQTLLENQVRMRLLPPLKNFIHDIFLQANLIPSVTLYALIYLDKLKKNLPKQATGEVDTPYRLFLVSILTASKFLSDELALSCQNLAAMTDYIYSCADINSMERSFLNLIGYNLFIRLEDIKHYLLKNGQSLQMKLE